MFYTVAEAAEILRLSQSGVRYLLAKKVIRGLKIGAVWRIPKKVIDDLCATP